MRVGLLCVDRGVPLGGTKGSSVHLRSIASALMRRGHGVSAAVLRRGDERDVAPLLAAGLDLTELPEASPSAVGSWLAATRPDWMLERLALFAPGGARAAASLGVPHLYEVNAPLDLEAAAHRGLGDPDRARRDLRSGFAATAGVIAVSDEVAAWVRRRTPRGTPIVVEPNGADPRFLASPDPEALTRVGSVLGPHDAFRVALVGTLRPWHDVNGLLRALARVRARRPVRAVLVGDGFERAGVRELACLLGVRHDLAGPVPHADMPAWLASVDAVAVPYARADLYFSPLKLVEAMAAGRPVVASATGPVRRFVTHRVNGMLVPPGDDAAMGAAIEELAANRLLRERLGRAARAAVEESMTWDHVAARIERLAARAAVAAGRCA